MGKTAVGLYGTSTEAQEVVRELVVAGFSRSNIHLMLGDQSSRQLHEWFDDAGATSAYGATNGGTVTTLTAAGVPMGDAQDYEEALHRGDALVSVSTNDARIDEAVEIMSRYNMLDIHERMAGWNATPGAIAANAARSELRAGEEATVPVIEEEVRVGKREVETGGVRVRSVVTETPVEETVNLREEHVHVERHPVDRAVSASDVANLRDQTVEVRETAEEAVIDKQARVVEEVVISKEAGTRQEQIHDTVRRTDVEVEQLGRDVVAGWDRYRDDFRSHYKTAFASRGRDYSYYEPGYRYGYDLLDTHPDWRGRSWAEIEADARRGWDPVQGPWDDFKDAVRHAWQRVTAY